MHVAVLQRLPEAKLIFKIVIAHLRRFAATHVMSSQNFFDMPAKKPRRGPYCGANTPMPLPSRMKVDGVEQIDDVEAHRHRLRIVRQQKFARDADVELDVGRHGAEILASPSRSPLP